MTDRSPPIRLMDRNVLVQLDNFFSLTNFKFAVTACNVQFKHNCASQAAQSRCTVVRPIQKSIGKWEI